MTSGSSATRGIRPCCPVRGCWLELVEDERGARCARGHSFDRARSGYLNLLQPQDRGSKHPGDSKETVAARRRITDRGLLDPLRDWLVELASKIAPRGPLLDVGCGHGFFTAALARTLDVPTCGVDISSFAIEAAARSHPECQWVVANADRRLPFTDGTFALVTSVTGPKNGRELARLLQPRGTCLLVVNGDDDLWQLREDLLGKALPLGRAERAVELVAPALTVTWRRSLRWTRELDQDALADAAASTYRGARHGERERLARLERLAVTFSYEALAFERTLTAETAPLPDTPSR